jgi:hypothetical protein
MLSADDARSVWLREREALLCFDISRRAKNNGYQKGYETSSNSEALLFHCCPVLDFDRNLRHSVLVFLREI